MNITAPLSPRARSPANSPRRTLPVAGLQRCTSPSGSPRAGHGSSAQPASAVVGTTGLSAHLSHLGLRSERRRRRSDDDLSFLTGHVPQAHMVPRGPADDPEEPLAALASFDGEEHKVPTKDIHAAATRVEDMLASFDGDAFSAVELHGSSLEQAAQLTPVIPTRSSRRMTLRGGVSTPTVAAAVGTAAVLVAAEPAAVSQEAPAIPTSSSAAAGAQEGPVTGDLWSVVSQHTNQLSAKLKASNRQKQGGDSWQQPGGMVSAMDTNERAEQQRAKSQAAAATPSAATTGRAAVSTSPRAAQQAGALAANQDSNSEGSNCSTVAAAAAAGGGGGASTDMDAEAGVDSTTHGQGSSGRRSLRRALAKVYQRVL